MLKVHIEFFQLIPEAPATTLDDPPLQLCGDLLGTWRMVLLRGVVGIEPLGSVGLLEAHMMSFVVWQ